MGREMKDVEAAKPLQTSPTVKPSTQIVLPFAMPLVDGRKHGDLNFSIAGIGYQFEVVVTTPDAEYYSEIIDFTPVMQEFVQEFLERVKEARPETAPSDRINIEKEDER